MNAPGQQWRPLAAADIRISALMTILILGVWFAGDFHSLHDEDSIIHSLNSLYQWTVFVWEYDHIGSLISLLARLFSRPYWNVLAVSAISSFLFLSGLALWATRMFPLTLAEAGLWTALLLPVVLTQHALFQLGSHSVSSGAALFFSGSYVLLLQRGLDSTGDRPSINEALLFASAFLAIYLSKVAFFPVAAVTAGLLLSARRLAWRKLLWLGAPSLMALSCYQLLEWASPYKRDYTLDLAILAAGLPRLLQNWSADAMTSIGWLAAPVLLLLLRPDGAGPVSRSLAAGVLFQTMVVAASRWAKWNDFRAHYLFDLSFLCILAAVVLAARTARYLVREDRRRVALLAAGAAALLVNVSGWHPSLRSDPLERIELRLGGDTSAIVDAECDLLVGDNRRAWPAMLAANDYFYRSHIPDPETGRTRRIYAITYLSAATEDLWRPILDRPGARLCSLAGDDAGYQQYLNRYAPDLAFQTVPVARLENVIVHAIDRTPLRYVRHEFDTPAPGEGWSPWLESTPAGETFQWMDATTATVLLPLAADRDVWLEFRVIHSMAPEILRSLTVSANDRPVSLVPGPEPGGGTIFRGLILRQTLAAAAGPTEITFRISHTLIPRQILPDSDDDRTLGLALDWLQVR
jgi:hypothetical protein